MARKRPIASDVQQIVGAQDASPRGRDRAAEGGGAPAVLSPAQQRALRRSAPLSTAEFKAVGQLVERGDLPLRRILRRRRAVR